MPHVVTKADLVQVAAKAGNLSKAAAGEALNAVFDAIVENVARGKRVTVVGFGTFLPRKRKARAGRSPVNGKEIKITARRCRHSPRARGSSRPSTRPTERIPSHSLVLTVIAKPGGAWQNREA